MASRIAILIGVNKYERARTLSFAVQDIEAFRDILINPQRGGFGEEFVKTLTDKENLKPLRANILTTVKNMSLASQPGDDILIYFSGHGLTHEGRAYLVPTEGYPEDPLDSCILLDSVYDILRSSKASRKVMIVDACYSGVEVGKPASGIMTRDFYNTLEKMGGAEGFAVVSSCRADEVSSEDSDLGHGVFSYYLQQGLSGPADTDGDFDISVHEAYEYTLSKVKEWAIKKNTRQTPTLNEKVAGDLVLVAVPHPKKTPLVKQSPSILQLSLTRKIDRIPYRLLRRDEAIESGKTSCLIALGELGALVAEMFGPQDVNTLDELIRSYSHGQFEGGYVDDGEQVVPYITFKIDPDVPKNLELFAELIGNRGFDEIEYKLSAPVNLLKAYGSLKSRSLRVQNYDPGRLLVGMGAYPLHIRLALENNMTDSRIQIKVIDNQATEQTIKSTSPDEIKKLIQETIS